VQVRRAFLLLTRVTSPPTCLGCCGVGARLRMYCTVGWIERKGRPALILFKLGRKPMYLLLNPRSGTIR
jgi:hypothetical protein